MTGQHTDREQLGHTRRRLAAFGAALAVTTVGAGFVGQQAASALDWRHGGAKVQCVTIYYSYPQYGISGFISKCGGGWHQGGPYV